MSKIAELGEKINDGGRGFKVWFTDFTLVYSPIFIVLGLILTGLDLFLNLGLSGSLWFRVPWSIAQLFAVDGLWFAVWNRILTDEYRRSLWFYHGFLIVLGISMTAIAITMNYIIFTQDYMRLKDSVAAMNFVGIPVGLFLFVRSVLLMLTATLAIVLDKVMRSRASRGIRPTTIAEVYGRDGHKCVNCGHVGTPGFDLHLDHVIPYSKGGSNEAKNIQVLCSRCNMSKHDKLAVPAGPTRIALPDPTQSAKSKYSLIRSTIERFNIEGRSYTYKDLATETGASLQTVKLYAPKIKQELEGRTN